MYPDIIICSKRSAISNVIGVLVRVFDAGTRAQITSKVRNKKLRLGSLRFNAISVFVQDNSIV